MPNHHWVVHKEVQLSVNYKIHSGASQRVHWVKALFTKPDDPNSIFRKVMDGGHGRRRKLITISCPLIYTHKNTDTCTQLCTEKTNK